MYSIAHRISTVSLLLALLVMACSVDGAFTAIPSDGMGDDGPVTITLMIQTFDGGFANTQMVGYQDGDGPWQPASGDAGAYKLTISSKRYGVVTGCVTNDQVSYVKVGYFTVSDGRTRYVVDSCRPPTYVTISGSINNTGGSDVSVSDGVSSGLTTQPQWSMLAKSGTGTLMGLRRAADRPIGMLLVRTTFAEGATFNLDFNGQFFPAESQLTLGAGSSNLSMNTTYIDESGLAHPVDRANAAVTTYRVVPADRVGNGISVLTYSAEQRSIERAFKSPIAQTLILPAALVPTQEPRYEAFSPYLVIGAALPKREGATHYTLSYAHRLNGVFRFWDMVYSAAWADGVDGADVVSRMPLLSALEGWMPIFGFPIMGGMANWQATISAGPAPRLPGSAPYGAQGQSTPPIDGDEVTTASALGVLPPL